MADNVSITAGSGTTIASDDVGGGVQVQRVKIVLGADGVNGGDVASGNPMPVNDAGGSLTVDGTVTANQGTAASTAGAWPAKVTDGTNTAAVTASSALKVDGSAVTQPISAASLPLPTGAAQDATLTGGTARTKITDGTNNAAVKAASTAAAATDPALVVAISPNNTVPVSDGGGSFTVDAAQLPAALVGGRLSVVADATGTLANGTETAVSSSAVQVLASNASRKGAILQNTGTANVRVGVSGVTATTGLQLTPGAIIALEMPFVPTQALFAIREGSVDSKVLAMEIT